MQAHTHTHARMHARMHTHTHRGRKRDTCQRVMVLNRHAVETKAILCHVVRAAAEVQWQDGWKGLALPTRRDSLDGERAISVSCDLCAL